MPIFLQNNFKDLKDFTNSYIFMTFVTSENKNMKMRWLTSLAYKDIKEHANTAY